MQEQLDNIEKKLDRIAFVIGGDEFDDSRSHKRRIEKIEKNIARKNWRHTGFITVLVGLVQGIIEGLKHMFD